MRLAEHFWRLAAVAQVRAFEGPAAARRLQDKAPARPLEGPTAGRESEEDVTAPPFQALPVGGQPRRAGKEGNLLADLLTARARTRAPDHVRPSLILYV